MNEINELQRNIMLFCSLCAKEENIPISQSKIVNGMKRINVKSYTTLNAIRSLLTKGYIRKAWSGNQNRTYYVMCRNI